MTTYTGMYQQKVAEVVQLTEQKAQRREQIAEQVFQANYQGANLDASIEHIVNGRVATDPISKDLQVMIDRAVAEATMYGIGALMRSVALLSTQRTQGRLPNQRVEEGT